MTISGLGKKSRQRLGEILRQTKGTVSVTDAARILNITALNAAQLLARWAEQGWLSRVSRGLYIPVALDAVSPDIPLEDPWIVAARLFSPCYIGGWSAAEHWGLTEQVFRALVIVTARKVNNRAPLIKGIPLLIHTTLPRNIFGTNSIWRGSIKVDVSDPTRTIVDLLSDPALGGGIRPVSDMFLSYMKSEHKDTKLLVEYGKRLGNRALFKRLGFLAGRFTPKETKLIDECMRNLSKGNAKLDPKLVCKRLVRKWRLWIPDSWRGEK